MNEEVISIEKGTFGVVHLHHRIYFSNEDLNKLITALSFCVGVSYNNEMREYCTKLLDTALAFKYKGGIGCENK